MCYYIVCTNRKGETLFLVNRHRFTGSWWTQKIELAMEYIHLGAAKQFLSRLYLNNPRIVDEKEAKKILRTQK